MELQLHDGGLEAFDWRRRFRQASGFIQRAAPYIPNPYFQAARMAYQSKAGQRLIGKGRRIYSKLLHEAQGTPTYYQFLNEEGLSGYEPHDLQASRFGTWIKTKAVPGIKKFQERLSPIIGMIPGGSAVNAAFDIIKRPAGGDQPATEPVFQPMGPTMPPAPGPMPQMPEMPQMPGMPSYGAYPPAAPSSGLPFGLDMKTLLLLGIGGIVAYKAFKK